MTTGLPAVTYDTAQVTTWVTQTVPLWMPSYLDKWLTSAWRCTAPPTQGCTRVNGASPPPLECSLEVRHCTMGTFIESISSLSNCLFRGGCEPFVIQSFYSFKLNNWYWLFNENQFDFWKGEKCTCICKYQECCIVISEINFNFVLQMWYGW